jgi:hypothetical protein
MDDANYSETVDKVRVNIYHPRKQQTPWKPLALQQFLVQGSTVWGHRYSLLLTRFF